MGTKIERAGPLAKESAATGNGGMSGTLLLAENGKLSRAESALTGLGFKLVRAEALAETASLVPPFVIVADEEGWASLLEIFVRRADTASISAPVVMIGDGELESPEPASLSCLLTNEFTVKQALVAIREAWRSASLQQQITQLQEHHLEGSRELEKLIEIGISLSSERNIDRLLDQILLKACEVTTADAGSIYIVRKNEQGERVLHFSNTLSHSLKLDFKAFTIPIGPDSIAGYVALTGESLVLNDCYNIPDRYQFSINKTFDESNNYRTMSMLAVAMCNQKDEITGVIQLINRKSSAEIVLSSPKEVEKNVIVFSESRRNLIEALASQAAVALENYQLYRDIENLFEGFVQASVTAIESRDPTTCGHSERVATLTVGIAEKINRVNTGPLREMDFSETQIKEIRYAALLHDFGKVGVKENVLLKAKKLYPEHLEMIKQRFDIAGQIYRKLNDRDKLEIALASDRQEYLDKFRGIDSSTREKLERLDRYLSQVINANEPSVLAMDDFAILEEIAGIVINDPDDKDFSLLEGREQSILSIPKGTLTTDERLEIESHVTHTYNFLTKIPWTSELKSIPEIAYGHHEKLDGSGYPRGVNAKQIQPQTRMMTISDIYDALTATDRPYKPAVPADKALDIIGDEVNMGKVDPELFKIFVDARVFDLVDTGRKKN
ncbi:MAG: GAF domain-containing protein [Candidatus Glassbacteria bacterium]|nr:GAF domain-containing protein [Candidatus Glassbacteria bacterium]